MKTINDVRKAIKPIGFNIKVKSLSWGPHASYINISTKKECPSIFTPETLLTWKPLFDWKKENREALRTVRNNTGVIGLI